MDANGHMSTVDAEDCWITWVRSVLKDERNILEKQLDSHHVIAHEIIDKRFSLLEKRFEQQSLGQQTAVVKETATDLKDLCKVEDSPKCVATGSTEATVFVEQAATEMGHRESGLHSAGKGDFERLYSGESKLTMQPQDSSSFISLQDRRRISRVQDEIKRLMTGRVSNLDPASFRGKLDGFVNGHFDRFMSVLIVLNTLLTLLELQRLGGLADVALGFEPQNQIPVTASMIQRCEQFFTVTFSLELLVRVYARQLAFFFKVYNILDAVIVPITVLDTFVYSDSTSQTSNISFIRMVRAVRMLRTMGHFKELQILLKTVISSCISVFWSMLLILIFQVMGACILCQALHGFIVDDSADQDMRIWVNKMYGSALKSMYTMFELTFSGGWPNYARPLIEDVSGYYALFFVAYVTAIVFALTRIVAALFLKETLYQATATSEIMVRDKKKDVDQMMKKLHAIFQEADISGDGVLNQDELAQILTYTNVRMLLAKLGIDVVDSQILFETLDDGSGEISRHMFVTGLKRLKGEARSIDLVPLVHKIQQILEHCKIMQKSLQTKQACESDIPAVARRKEGLIERYSL